MNSVHTTAPLLEIRDLRLVHAIDREGGISRAARVLHLTQSALSHHLRALEQRMGVILFERSGRSLLLNQHGAKVAALAERILPELCAVERSILAPESVKKTFRIAMGCYTVYPWLPMLMQELAREAPHIQCVVVPEATPRAVAAVLEGEIDAAVVPNVPRDNRLAIRRAFDEDIVVVMRPDDALAKRTAITVADLSGRVIFAHQTPPDQVAWFRAALGRTAPLLRGIVRVPLTEAIVDLVRGGAGLAILGAWTVARDLARGELVTRPLKPSVRRTLSVVTARHARTDARVELLAAVLTAMPQGSPPNALDVTEPKPRRARAREAASAKRPPKARAR